MQGRTIVSIVFAAMLCAPLARAGLRKPAPIPPGSELQILDPRVDPRGMPTAVPQMAPDGSMQIDIPPTVIVHKYYYTGNRSFQGPLLTGGPTVVVANHPKSGERVYIPVQLPPGAPKIVYTHHAIEYDYGHQGVKIVFNRLLHRPKIEYRNHTRVRAIAAKPLSKMKDAMKNLVVRSGLAEAAIKAKEKAKNAVVNGVDQAGNIGKMALTPIKRVVSMIPGVKMLSSSPEQQASQLRKGTIGIEELRKSPVDQFVPTK